MEQDDGDRLNMNHATEAFGAFVRWSRKQAKSSAVMPVLVIFDDGSGHIEDAQRHELLRFNGCDGFSDFADLVEKLSENK